MTTMFKEIIQCAVCAERSEHFTVGSTNTSGSVDLDTRPPEMMRSTISMWIMVCPSCGYCSMDISKCSDKSPELVRSPAYQRQLKNPQFPDTANAFLCSLMIKELAGQYAKAEGAHSQKGYRLPYVMSQLYGSVIPDLNNPNHIRKFCSGGTVPVPLHARHGCKAG